MDSKWNVLSPFSDKQILTDIELSEFKIQGFKRLELLKKLQNKQEGRKKIPKSIFYELISEFFPTLMNTTPSNSDLESYFLGHYFLRIAASTSPKLESYLCETEGDLFEQFFSDLPHPAQLSLAQELFGSERLVVQADILSNELDLPGDLFLSSFWGVHWSVVPWQVGSKRGFLHKGYLFGSPRLFFSTLKKTFEKKLRKKIFELKENEQFQDQFVFNVPFQQALKELDKDILSSLPGSDFVYDMDINMGLGKGVKLNKNFDFYPPCMKYLLESFKETGYLKHNYRFQIGLYLKRIGMDVETQLRFWYDSAVDNVGLTYETFKKRAGYIIRHIYGIEGSRIDYHVPKCKKLMTDYFCLFTHVNPKELKKSLPLMYQPSKIISPFQDTEEFEEVVNLAVNHRSAQACSKMFELLYKKKLKIYHPLVWTKNCIEILNLTEN